MFMLIDASLFAHIENDSFLNGIYKLQGNRFSRTVEYLSKYIEGLSSANKPFPTEYADLLAQMKYLVTIEHKLKCNGDVEPLAQSIAKSIMDLPPDGKLFIPGGWQNNDGGHAMVYEFVRQDKDFNFSAINAGEGLNYHAKKSRQDKEVYNPKKTWHVPNPSSPKDKEELAHFIAQLLKARLPVSEQTQNKTINGKVLYEEILPTISYINGREIDANKEIPEHAFTGGQLSGTCTQRCLHQMFKAITQDEKTYQKFIYDFKQSALFDYSEVCMQHSQPYTPAVAKQIRLAIKNNLKILNTPGLFDEKRVEEELNKFTLLKKSLKDTSFDAHVAAPVASKKNVPLSITAGFNQAPLVPLMEPNHDKAIVPHIHLNDGTKLLANLAEAIKNVQQIEDKAAQYNYLEQLLLQLPLSKYFPVASGFYREINGVEALESFKKQLNELQTLLLALQNDWIKKNEQTPKMNVLLLSITSLHMDAFNATIPDSNKPNFKPYSDVVMRSLVENQHRNPYYATNNPILDERLKTLRERYKGTPQVYNNTCLNYFKSLLKTEPELINELDTLYNQKFGHNTSELHCAIRKDRFESFFMILEHHKGRGTLAPKFNPIISKVMDHMTFESKMRKAINPFYQSPHQYNDRVYFSLFMINNGLYLNTPLLADFTPSSNLLKVLSETKYSLNGSPAKVALDADIPEQSVYEKPITARSANNIQLHPGTSAEQAQQIQHVTQADIAARDYLHLRSEPELQIALTLDYFTRHIEKLAGESNQKYVEANLFQPGLMITALKSPAFLPQFDSFLQTGKRFFTQNGQHTADSLLYLRLDFLVSRYLAHTQAPLGLERLKTIQNTLEMQLSLPLAPDITYMLQHYQFLNLVAQMELGEQSSELFNLAYTAYHYIQSHTNPLILEDRAHLLEVDCTIAKFKEIIRKQPQSTLKKFADTLCTEPSHQFNELQGKLYKDGLAQSGVPLALQKHPLIKELGLDHIKECLMDVDETYMILPGDNKGSCLFYNNNNLIVQKTWTIKGNLINYELQALTENHQAKHANKYSRAIKSKLPSILTDGTMNYWQGVNNAQSILVQNNIPVYSVRENMIWALDAEGNETGAQLTASNSPLLESFESPEFQLTHVTQSDTVIKLPRYNLSFKSQAGTLINQETNEQVLDRPSPIHPAVAGLVMDNKGQQRYLVPIACFYSTKKGAQQSDFYPVVHDIEGTIAQTTLKEHWSNNPPLQQPMWHYPNTEHYVSFQLKDGEPIANSVADALYLTYMYLATNQTKKAWKTLEECTTRLGGITGSLDELKYIAWICKEMPHVLPGQKKAAKYKKDTPPYVVCQLKAMSLLCDHLSQNGPIPINKTKPLAITANSEYESLCTQDLDRFQASLPDTIYQSFTQLQRMRRHQDHTYRLSPLERKQLLSYYHQSQPKDHAPKGALGFEWLSLSLETLQEEREALLARQVADQSLSPGDQKRLDRIEANLKKLKPVVAQSTVLEQVPINLDLPHNSTLKTAKLSKITTKLMDEWLHILPGKEVGTSEKAAALNALVSTISDDEFMAHFPAYLQMTQSGTKEQCADLLDFCTKTLLAKRHISLEQQKSNIPLLCNILYRILATDNTTLFKYRTFNFSELVSSLSVLKVSPLQVYQAKDVYHDILATPEQIMTQQERPRHAPLIATNSTVPSLIVPTEIDTILNKTAATSKTLLDQLISDYKQSTNKSEEELVRLGKTLNNTLDNTFAIEERAGGILLDLEQQKNAGAEALISNKILTQALLTAITSAESQIKTQKELAWGKALTLANQGPQDPNRARAWAIEKKAKARPELTQSDLMSLYSRADFAYSVEKTGLSLTDVQRVHDATHQALIHGIQHQALTKIRDNLEKASATGNANIAAQALDVLSRTEIPGLEEPSVVILQHEEQILLRKRQVSALKSLLKEPEDGRRFNETIEKIIMGGGKSKVILPILAEKKAQGDNLVVVEVPQALLATNHVDLNQTSQRLFGKRAYRFEFNRDSDSSPKRLETMYHQFIEIMTTRSYLVTTGESVQSLELKYLELLMANGKQDDTWKQQIYWCDKITNLFRHHADCIIDEVHQGLSTKKKLNYTSGKPNPISPLLIKNATDLFSFIDLKIIKEAPSFDEDYDWTSFKTNLATKLITEPASLLTSFVNQAKIRYGATVQAELIAYLLNQALTMPEAVLTADAETKATFGFFKQEINVRLPQTLPQELYKKYGPSKRKDLSPVEQTLAIPYAGTHVPNERNRYQDELEAINKTCQMMMLEGISKELLVERIAEWEALAREELLKMPANATPKPTIDNTPTAQGFALLTHGLDLKLSEVDSKNSDQMTKVHQHLRFNRPFIFDCLRESSLKQIQQDSAIISSDNFNHADQYRSVQGISGTPPWNDAAYHHRLSYDKTSSLGTDGFIFELMRNKKSPVSGCDYDNVTQFISTILSRSSARERTRAIIDIKGTFTDVNNLEVAKQIALYIRTNPAHFNSPIKQVLYFNEDQVLCALDVANPAKTTVLGTSETSVLNRMLDSTPEERFTLYDQIHTLGTDIKQYGEAHAIVLVDDKTSMQDFLQGCMRERELELNQTNEIIVPQRMHGVSLDTLGTQFKNNDRQAVFAETTAAAFGQMRNHIRRQFLSLIQDIPSEDAEKKAVLTQHFKPLFEDIPSLDLFALYGGINKKKAIEEILDHYKKQMQMLWEARIKAADLALHDQDNQRVADEMQRIIERAMPFCLPEYEGLDNSVSAEVEVQKEVQKEVQIENLTLNETYHSQRMERSIKKWPYWVDIDDHFNNHSDIGTYSVRLNYICTQDSEQLNLFSNNLYTSKNYAHTYKGQTNFVDAFLKPVFLIWYQVHKGQLSAMIVTPQEALQLANNFKRVEGNWLSTTQDTVIAGYRPKDILNDTNYQELREQIRFFNGEFSSLLDQEDPLLWVQEQTEKKINFYKNTLLACRPGNANKLQQFEAYLTQAKVEGFAYIADCCFDDLTQFDWEKLYPEIITKQVEEFQKLAKAFVYLNQSWDKTDLKLADLQQQFHLPVNSLMYINSHLTHLMTLKQILNGFEKIRGSKTFLKFVTDDLKPTEKKCLEQCIGMTINQFSEQCRNEDILSPFLISEDISISIHSISLLNILNTYPALKDRDQLNTRFEDIALNATSEDELDVLLSQERLTPKLIFNIINNPRCNDSLMVRILNTQQPLSEENVLALAKKSQSSDYVDSLLKLPNITHKVLLELIQKNFLSDEQILFVLNHLHAQKPDIINNILKQPNITENILGELIENHKLNESQLITLIKRTRNRYLLLGIITDLSLSAPVITEMLKHASLSFSCLKRLLKNSLTEEQLLLVLEHQFAKDPEIINYVLEQPNTNHTVLLELIQKDFLSESQIIAIIKRSTRTVIMHAALEHHKPLSVPVITEMLKHDVLSVFVLKDLLAETPFTEEQLLFVLRHRFAKNAEIINNVLLNQSNITTKILDELSENHILSEAQNAIIKLKSNKSTISPVVNHLFKNPAYNGEIKEWDENTKNQFMATLDKTKDFNSLKITFEHLPKAELHQWHEDELAKHKNAIVSVCEFPQIKDKVFCALNVLKLKSLSRCINAIDNPAYEQAAQTSFQLYQKLHAQAERFFNNPLAKGAEIDFEMNCRDEVNKAKLVLYDLEQVLDEIYGVIYLVSGLYPKGYTYFTQLTSKNICEVDNILKHLYEVEEKPFNFKPKF